MTSHNMHVDDEAVMMSGIVHRIFHVPDVCRYELPVSYHARSVQWQRVLSRVADNSLSWLTDRLCFHNNQNLVSMLLG